MNRIRLHIFGLLAVVLVLGAWRQATVAASDIARLDATAADTDTRIQQLKGIDPTLADQTGRALADLRDDITYLRVKLRRDGAVSAADYNDVRDRLETLRVRVENATRVTAQPVLVGDPMSATVLPVGTEFEVRLQTPLSSRTAKVEQRFEATTIEDVGMGRETLIPAGSVVRGFVSSVRPAGRIDRTGSLTLSFDELAIGTRQLKLRAAVVRALDPSVSQDMSRIGAGAAVGAVLVGLLAGGKGALLGVLIGGGGTVASTEGSDVDLPAGVVLRIRLDQPLDVNR